jgi:hypothetical protein
LPIRHFFDAENNQDFFQKKLIEKDKGEKHGAIVQASQIESYGIQALENADR